MRTGEMLLNLLMKTGIIRDSLDKYPAKNAPVAQPRLAIVCCRLTGVRDWRLKLRLPRCVSVFTVRNARRHGANVGADVYYSGTVAAVREAILHVRHDIAFSHYRKGADFDWACATR